MVRVKFPCPRIKHGNLTLISKPVEITRSSKFLNPFTSKIPLVILHIVCHTIISNFKYENLVLD